MVLRVPQAAKRQQQGKKKPTRRSAFFVGD
jgi:hypothetical protein